MAENADWEQRGARLKELRTGLGLYQKQFAEQLLAAGVVGPDGKLDQPTVSEMERGKAEIPDSVFAAIEGGLVKPGPAEQPPPPGAAGGNRGGRRRRSSRPAPAAAVPPAATPAPPDAGPDADDDELDVDDPDELDDDEVMPGRPADAPPRAPSRPPQPAPLVDERAVTALELELVKLFKGSTFLVPVDVGNGVEHMEAQIPGLAQIVGAMNAADGAAIEMSAEAMAHAWAELARQNATVRRILMGLTYGGAWKGVLLATAPVIYAIAVNHGLIPNMLGAGPPPAPAPAEPIPYMAHVPVNADPPATVSVPQNGASGDAAGIAAQMQAIQDELARREAGGAAG